MHSPLRDPLTRPVQFFTGKGGVGKSTILGAVATSAARAGQRPLIVELGTPASSSRWFRGADAAYEPSEVSRGVFATRVEFEPALVDYITSRLKLRPIATLVARNTSLRRLFLAAPGVDEIVTLHRVAELAASDRWGPILVDLESTGHALMFFDLPEVLEVFLKDGPLRQVLDSASALVRDEQRSSIHIVTVPEALAVNETIQLYERLRARSDLHLGCLFINRIPLAWLTEDEQRLVDAELDAAGDGDPCVNRLKLARYIARRNETAAKCLRGLRRDVDLPTLRFDAHEDDGSSLIETLSRTVEAEGVW